MPLGEVGEAERSHATIAPRGSFPAFCMDQTPLHAFIAELAASDRFQAFTKALPGRARVSEPALPLVLAALHEELARGLLILLPEDADARDAAEGASWFLGTERVALLPSRGVSHASGLEPPPHLVGERARALDVLAAGGLVCASAAALAEGMPPLADRPETVRLTVGEEPGLDGLAEALASAGYERVDRVDERGQFAVRGGIVDVFPSTGREPLRVELFGDEIEQVRAFSPFTQRALHTIERRADLPRRRAAQREHRPGAGAQLGGRRREARIVDPATSSRRSTAPPDFIWQPDEVRAVWEEEGLTPVALDGATELDPFPRGQAFQFEAQRPAIAARGLAEAENELLGFVRSGNRVVVTFPHRGEAQRQGALLRKVESTILPDGAALPRDAGVRFAVSPARRGFVWRDLGLVLLPDTQVFRKRPPRADARLGRALASFADLRIGDYVVHEDHGVGKLLGFETKEVAGVTRDYLFLAFRGDDRLYVPHEQLGKLSRYIGADAKAPALSKLGGKAWQNLKTRARESVRELAGELLALYAQRQRAEGVELRSLERVARAPRGVVPVPGDRGPGARDRGRQGGPRVDPADGPARLRRRRLRQDRGRGPRRVRGRRQRQAGARALPDDDPRRAALEHVPRALPRLPAQRRDGVAVPQAGRDEAGARRLRRGQGRRARRHAPRPVPRRDPEGARARHPRRGAALRRRPEGAPALDPARGRRARALGHADSADAPHVALRPPRHLDHRDAARGAAADQDDRGGVRRGRDQAGARAGARVAAARRSTSTTASRRSRRWARSCVSSARASGSSSPTARWGSAISRSACTRSCAGDADVLVSTTIIESGIDIPQANTLIVERADTLGLSQLYQIRGRVGRSDVTAHAYLFYPDASELTPEARARLATLADHTELGAGFQIAMRDLEIRGAGDLLGAEQSGHVAALGFELYVEMLNEAVAELSGPGPRGGRGRCASTRGSTPSSPPRTSRPRR